jgi:hypothetical protein
LGCRSPQLPSCSPRSCTLNCRRLSHRKEEVVGAAEAVAMEVAAATAVAMVAAEAEAETMAPITPVPRVASQTAHTVRKQPPAPTPMVMAWHQMGRFPAHSVH